MKRTGVPSKRMAAHARSTVGQMLRPHNEFKLSLDNNRQTEGRRVQKCTHVSVHDANSLSHVHLSLNVSTRCADGFVSMRTFRISSTANKHAFAVSSRQHGARSVLIHAETDRAEKGTGTKTSPTDAEPRSPNRVP